MENILSPQLNLDPNVEFEDTIMDPEIWMMGEEDEERWGIIAKDDKAWNNPNLIWIIRSFNGGVPLNISKVQICDEILFHERLKNISIEGSYEYVELLGQLCEAPKNWPNSSCKGWVLFPYDDSKSTLSDIPYFDTKCGWILCFDSTSDNYKNVWMVVIDEEEKSGIYHAFDSFEDFLEAERVWKDRYIFLMRIFENTNIREYMEDNVKKDIDNEKRPKVEYHFNLCDNFANYWFVKNKLPIFHS